MKSLFKFFLNYKIQSQTVYVLVENGSSGVAERFLRQEFPDCHVEYRQDITDKINVVTPTFCI